MPQSFYCRYIRTYYIHLLNYHSCLHMYKWYPPSSNEEPVHNVIFDAHEHFLILFRLFSLWIIVVFPHKLNTIRGLGADGHHGKGKGTLEKRVPIFSTYTFIQITGKNMNFVFWLFCVPSSYHGHFQLLSLSFYPLNLQYIYFKF